MSEIMSNYSATEELLECPFDPVHRIIPHRMTRHITKCWKNHRDADVKVCPFNATHIIKTALFQSHIVSCPERAIVERDIYLSKTVHDQQLEKKKKMNEVAESPLSTCGEDWDSELSVSTYKPEEHLIHRDIVRPPPPGMGKAARREWREREMERVQCIREGRPIYHLINSDTSGGTPQENVKVLQQSGMTVDGSVTQGQRPRLPRIAANIGLYSGKLASEVTHKGDCERISVSPIKTLHD
ncbi:gametocyte-specific factor 1 homolog isoform X3 [Macrobrachium nipponense]|uniref:gametocyte-specific factor 1 homolog isoform X3 n=1 Tax=Macrobrachium nipponense TaxID=159736 RepID=UPI0030C8AEDA